MNRADVTFRSAGTRCAGWLYRPTDTKGAVPCVVMAHGFGLTRHDRLTSYAEALTRAGAAVLKLCDSDHFGPFHGDHATAIITDQVSWLHALPRV